MTIRASTFSRSASNERRTLSFSVSPKKVTPGLNTPPQTSSEVVRARLIDRWSGSLDGVVHVVEDVLLVLLFRLPFCLA